MGTLIGAPLGIALAAGVVLPAMVIGIPVYVGRQVSINVMLLDSFALHIERGNIVPLLNVFITCCVLILGP